MYPPGHHADCRRAAIDHPFRGGSELPFAAPPNRPRTLDARNRPVGPRPTRLGTSSPHRSPNLGSRAALTASGLRKNKARSKPASPQIRTNPLLESPAGDFHFSATVDLRASSRSGHATKSTAGCPTLRNGRWIACRHGRTCPRQRARDCVCRSAQMHVASGG